MPRLQELLVIVTLCFPLAAAGFEWLYWTRSARRIPIDSARLKGLSYLTLIASLISLLLSIALMILFTGGQIGIPPLVFALASPEISFGFFYLDALSVYFILLVNVVAFASSWTAIYYLANHVSMHPRANPLEFHFLFNIFHFTMLLVAMVNNLVILWIAVELTTLVSTMLVAYRQERAALEAAWKYIIITSTGIIFALLGTMFLANAFAQPADADMNWSRLKDIAATLNPEYVKLSFVFILVGYGTKAGLAPMFTWLPDGHGEAPSPVSAMLSGVLLKSALYAILRFYIITNTALKTTDPNFTSNLLLAAGLLSLTMAVPFILKSNPFKRVLAYHSLEHMGIIIFGIGIGGSVALFGALLHAFNHALTKALMFLTFGQINSEFEREKIPPEQISGTLQTLPMASTLLFLGGLALVGSPPFNIFMSEFIILWGALNTLGGSADPLQFAARIIAIALFVGSILFIFGGLVRHLARLLLGPAIISPRPEQLRALVPLFLLLLAILVTGITLAPLAELLNRSVAIILPPGAR